jgi:Zn-dependent peptidase ImmA (M78 family)
VTLAEENRWIVDVVGQTYRDAELSWPPAPSGPMPLDRLIQAYPLIHEEIPGLNRAVVANQLARWGVRWPVGPGADESLAGFLYANAQCGYIFVRRGDGLPRRRFTAAHELGHYRLHLAPELVGRDLADAERGLADHQITESAETEVAEMERQANRFAAELLMPEAVCRILYETSSRKYGSAERFLVYHLASELLVSRAAIEWRLFGLGLIERPARREAERAGTSGSAIGETTEAE